MWFCVSVTGETPLIDRAVSLKAGSWIKAQSCTVHWTAVHWSYIALLEGDSALHCCGLITLIIALFSTHNSTSQIVDIHIKEFQNVHIVYKVCTVLPAQSGEQWVRGTSRFRPLRLRPCVGRRHRETPPTSLLLLYCTIALHQGGTTPSSKIHLHPALSLRQADLHHYNDNWFPLSRCNKLILAVSFFQNSHMCFSNVFSCWNLFWHWLQVWHFIWANALYISLVLPLLLNASQVSTNAALTLPCASPDRWQHEKSCHSGCNQQEWDTVQHNTFKHPDSSAKERLCIMYFIQVHLLLIRVFMVERCDCYTDSEEWLWHNSFSVLNATIWEGRRLYWLTVQFLNLRKITGSALLVTSSNKLQHTK